MGKVAFLFPGQGSAAIGMGEALATESPAAKHVLDQLGALAPAVWRLVQEGPRAGVSDPGVQADARFAYKQLWQRLPPDKRTDLPDPASLSQR